VGGGGGGEGIWRIVRTSGKILATPLLPEVMFLSFDTYWTSGNEEGNVGTRSVFFCFFCFEGFFFVIQEEERNIQAFQLSTEMCTFSLFKPAYMPQQFPGNDIKKRKMFILNVRK